MPGINNFPAGFAAGVTIRGVSVAVTHPGKAFWVSNAATLSDRQTGGSDGNKGTFDSPFSSITGALAQVTANRGDIIFVKPGHTETVTAAAGIILNKSGVAIIGLGSGSNRPTITYTTANTASITVTANNVSVSNILFVGGFLNVAAAFVIANAQVATDFTVDNCEFRDSSAILNFVACVKIGTTANIADGLKFTNNVVIGKATTPAAGTTAVVTASDVDRMVVQNNWISHNILLNSTSAVVAAGALNLTHLLIDGNKVTRPNTTSTGEILSSSSTACTGLISNNIAGTLSANGLIAPVSTKLAFSRNFCMITGAADKSALENPAAV